MSYLLVFLAMTFADIAWARYTIELAAKRAMHSAVWSAVIVANGGFITLSYLKEPNSIWAAIAGAFVGTYITVWHANRK